MMKGEERRVREDATLISSLFLTHSCLLSLQIAAAVSSVIILCIVLWIGYLFESLPKV